MGDRMVATSPCPGCSRTYAAILPEDEPEKHGTIMQVLRAAVDADLAAHVEEMVAEAYVT